MPIVYKKRKDGVTQRYSKTIILRRVKSQESKVVRLWFESGWRKRPASEEMFASVVNRKYMTGNPEDWAGKTDDIWMRIWTPKGSRDIGMVGAVEDQIERRIEDYKRSIKRYLAEMGYKVKFK